MKYFVDCTASKVGTGAENAPFKTISEAAKLAVAGDEILVAPGIYREYVDPKNAGTKDKPIVYRSMEKGAAVITGAEEVKGWEHVEGNVWKVSLPNAFFRGNNPFTTLVRGDWFIATFIAHTGDVFLNGKSMYEVTDKAKVVAPEVSKASWDPDFSVYVWYTEQDPEKDETVILANFQGKDPNVENVEITTRNRCFFPSETGVNYITLSGFTVCKAACQWAPPTAFQEGMIGPHWSKGWIIEDCHISEAKCSGISLGKYRQEGNDNKWLKTKYKDGTQTQRECVMQAQREGWTKENIGHHIIRRCEIHDCGQTGIVGHLGGVFSVIEDCHIYNINNKQNLAGAEIGGIKMHAAIDVIYRRLHIHHCTRGMWLDWQAQGTRVTQCLFHDNALPHDFLHDNEEALQGIGDDIFVEVSHGPTLIDNNFLLSERSIKMAAQGIAVVHNLIAGALTAVGTGTDNGSIDLPSPRYTPYHVQHQTEVEGFMTTLHGDDRFYNNIFIQQPIRPDMQALMEKAAAEHDVWDDNNIIAGTLSFDEYPTFEEWDKDYEGYVGMGSPRSDRYYKHLPVWTGGNIFLNGAKPCKKEENYILGSTDATVSIAVEEKEDGWHVKTNLSDVIDGLIKQGKNHAGEVFATEIIDTDKLGLAFEPEEKFENPDETPITLDEDYFGTKRIANPAPGSVEKLDGYGNVVYGL